MSVGAWSAFKTDINKEEMEVFKKALDGLEGVNYTPLAVLHQIVNGVNYRFFCNAIVVMTGTDNDGAIISIFQSTDGKAKISNIKVVTN